jgi:hypothetical protein
VRHSRGPESPLPFDLHVLSLPLAFILSQDQTLRCKEILIPSYCNHHISMTITITQKLLLFFSSVFFDNLKPYAFLSRLSKPKNLSAPH